MALVPDLNTAPGDAPAKKPIANLQWRPVPDREPKRHAGRNRLRHPNEHVEDARVPLKVLAAEDHPVCRELLGLVLTQFGAEATLVGDGQAAVEAWRQREFDVLLLDIHMPRLTGLQAAKIIREEERDGPRIPIVVISSDFLPEHITAALDAGADLHISKPVTAKVLAGALVSVLRADDLARDLNLPEA